MRSQALLALALLATLSDGTAVMAQDAPKATGKVAGRVSTTTKLVSRGAVSQVELVVWLEPKEKVAIEAKERTAEVRQNKLQFSPRALPVVVGTKVTFLNDDRVTHNVFIESECCKVDQDAKNGEQVERQFTQQGVFPVVCRLHPEMMMTVLVLPTVWFTTAKFQKQKAEDGSSTYVAEFSLEGVPPGKYVLRSWNQKLEPLEQEVEVKADATTEVVTNAQK